MIAASRIQPSAVPLTAREVYVGPGAALRVAVEDPLAAEPFVLEPGALVPRSVVAAQVRAVIVLVREVSPQAGSWRRMFTLSASDGAALVDLSGMGRVSVSVVDTARADGSPPIRLGVSVHQGEGEGDGRLALAKRPLRLILGPYNPGAYFVPPGAAEVVWAAADPGASWIALIPGGPAAVIPSPIVAGVAQPVASPVINLLAPQGAASWRIDL